MKHLSTFISKMEKEGLSPIVIDTFSYYYKKVVEGETGLVFDRDIDPVNKDEFKDDLIEEKEEILIDIQLNEVRETKEIEEDKEEKEEE